MRTLKLIMLAKAGMKNIAVVQGFIDTAVAVLDQATNINTKLMELAILSNNSTNTSADLAAIQAEYNAMTAEITALLASTYKGASLFGGTSMSVALMVGLHKKHTVQRLNSFCDDTNFSRDYRFHPGLVTVQKSTDRGALGANSAALAAAADYLTDLTAMYEIGYNTVNDVNFH